MSNLYFELLLGKSIVVTGTKGKSTTVLLISEILKQNGKKVFIGGNIKLNPLDNLDKLDDQSFSVLEMSSFQLQDFKHTPDYAIILPLHPDHLDYHESEQEYFLSKKGAFENSPKTIVLSSKSNQEILGLDNISNKVVFFSEEKLSDGCSRDGDSIVCDSKTMIKSDVDKFCQKHMIPVIDLIAAISLAFAENLEVDLEGLSSTFTKLPFRLEHILEKDGVKFFNDSASTNPISTIEAIKRMSGKTALIIGGASKNLDYIDLISEIVKNPYIVQVYLFGQSGKEMKQALLNAKYNGEIYQHETLKQVFESLKPELVRNILFSPGFTSFDQYKDYIARGEEFNELVKSL